jgi:hypothetical protein
VEAAFRSTPESPCMNFRQMQPFLNHRAANERQRKSVQKSGGHFLVPYSSIIMGRIKCAENAHNLGGSQKRLKRSFDAALAGHRLPHSPILTN